NTSKRIESLCEAKIKITHIVATQTVRVEHFKNTSDHSHPIEDSDLIKILEAIRQIVAQEASKPYTSPNIVMTVK
ncbi:11137_t:CDS:1, partial [Racocetra persica]